MECPQTKRFLTAWQLFYEIRSFWIGPFSATCTAVYMGEYVHSLLGGTMSVCVFQENQMVSLPCLWAFIFMEDVTESCAGGRLHGLVSLDYRLLPNIYTTWVLDAWNSTHRPQCIPNLISPVMESIVENENVKSTYTFGFFVHNLASIFCTFRYLIFWFPL